ncbi:MAG: ATP-binding cassette domain-containing protein [Gemmobacter sp.]
MTALLRLEGVAARAPGRLAGVALVLGPGEVMGLAGRNGAGKTTLGRLIARLDPLGAGRIALSGSEIGQIAPADFARHPLRPAVQMVLADAGPSLPPGQSIARTLKETRARLGAAGTAADAMAVAGFDPALAGRRPGALSQGQAVRAALARALIACPRVLILDECFAALDASARAEVVVALLRWRAETGAALIVIGHDMGLMRLMCGRVAILEGGRIVEEGAAAEVLGAPRHPATRALCGG